MERIIKKHKTIILFDLDGTLIDSTEAIVNSFYHSFEELKFNFKGTENDIKKEIGYPLEIMYKSLGVDKNKTSDFVNSYKKEYRKISQAQTFLLEDSLKAVKLASSFARLGVVTTKTTLYTIPLLKNFKIMNYFEVIIGRQEVINPKPNPEPVLKALNMMEIKELNHNIFMVGDTKLDLIAGNKAKINTVGVLCGYGEKSDLSNYTPNIADNSLDAVKLIQKMVES
jgi:phosphoglycolate phosphatase